ncbi:hypothetical protein [Streptomyces sp. NPDC050485]|uniref:hypothetical protein n=1 Tax=Streptomyces sp. NPDC050485 TaxID=3365617 RepID=UPI0037A359D3
MSAWASTPAPGSTRRARPPWRAWAPARPSSTSAHGEGACRGQGGCGYAGTDYEQFHPGEQDCRYNGSCASPINESRVFSAGPLKGKSVWKQARRLFEARMYAAGKSFGRAPGEGVEDDRMPHYDYMSQPP